MRDIDMIVIHCSATPDTMDIGVNTIRDWHVNERNWVDVGYHFVIRRDGKIQKGRDLHVVGSHARDFNKRSIGICYVGGVDGENRPCDNRTQAQIESMGKLIDALKVLFPTINTICGHRDLPNVSKYCPSFDVKKWLDDRSKD